MRKSPEEKANSRAWGFANADKAQWERLIDNPKLVAEVIKLQTQYRLPIPSKDIFAWMDWLEPIKINTETRELVFGEHAQRREKLKQEVNELAKRFEFPEKYIDSLHNMILTNQKFCMRMSLGLPLPQVDRDEMGKLVYWIKITPDTDLGNPMILELIKQWQANNKAEPPQPTPMMGNKRKLDWRPVWEWRKRHPDITVDEIAKMLYRNRVTVNRALAILDKAN